MKLIDKDLMSMQEVRELVESAKEAQKELNGYEGPYHDFNGITSKFGCHFILKVDRILMKKKYADAIINGVRACDFHVLDHAIK